MGRPLGRPFCVEEGGVWGASSPRARRRASPHPARGFSTPLRPPRIFQGTKTGRGGLGRILEAARRSGRMRQEFIDATKAGGYARRARMAGRSRVFGLEESPDSMRQRCRVTPGRGNPRESATEKKPPLVLGPRVRVKRWGKSPPRDGQPDWQGKPHREQRRIGTSRGNDRLCGRYHRRDISAQRSGLAARTRR